MTLHAMPVHDDAQLTQRLPSGARVPAAVLPPNPTSIEWPTLAALAACLSSLGLVLAFGADWPLPVTLLVLAFLGAWYSSIQHEGVHGHPTPSPTANMVFLQAPLGLIYPYWLYRDLHLIHHRDENLTDPDLDPESNYVTPERWAAMSTLLRWIRLVNQTLLGRVIVGPALAIVAVFKDAIRRVGDGENRAGVVRWAAAVAVILVGIDALGFPVWIFTLGFGYFGLSITMIRSFAEHRAVDDDVRCAVVCSRWFWGLIYMSVNLHVTHHRHPALPWYELRRVHGQSDAERVAAASAGLYRSYPALIARYFFRPVDQVAHPGVTR